MARENYLRHDAPWPDADTAKPGTLDAGEPLHMTVECYYSLGGHSFFSGDQIERGYWLSFTPSRIGPQSRSMILGDNRGRRILLQEANRRSDKTGAALAARLDPRKGELAEAAKAQDWQRCTQIARTVCAS